MRCQFSFRGETPCGNQPTDGRRVPMRHGDQIEVLFCHLHAQLFDIYEHADKEEAARARRA